MKKTFIKPEISKLELYLRENIASSDSWDSWVSSTYYAWDGYDGCNEYVSDPNTPLGKGNYETLSKAIYENRGPGFYTQWATVLNNCDLTINPLGLTSSGDSGTGVLYMSFSKVD